MRHPNNNLHSIYKLYSAPGGYYKLIQYRAAYPAYAWLLHSFTSRLQLADHKMCLWRLMTFEFLNERWNEVDPSSRP